MTVRVCRRCPVCCNRSWHDRGRTVECTHCGLVADPDVARHPSAAGIATWIEAGAPEHVARDWSLPGHALRNAAWNVDHVLDPDRSARPARPIPHAVTLAVMARPQDQPGLHDLLGRFAPKFEACLVLLDGRPDELPLGPLRSECSQCPGIRFDAHPLAGDFAAQRNRLQAWAGSGWILQLDTDETPSDALLERLGWLTQAADRDGLISLGLPRRNIVDGTLSSLYPDIQYRLNRGEIRFEGRVHERPAAPFERTGLALCAPLEHRLGSARVRERTRVYSAMSPDGGREQDETALLTPFDREAMASR